MHEQPLGVDIPLEPNENRHPHDARDQHDARQPHDPREPHDNGPWRWRRVMWPAVGVVALAATAIVVGQMQRPRPAPQQPPLETMLASGNALSTEVDGDRVLLTVVIKNMSHNPVTVTNPQVESGAGVKDLEVRLEIADDTYPLHGDWSPPAPIVINPFVDGQVALRFTLDCAHADPQLPLFPAIAVTASAGNSTSVANVTPGKTTLDDVGIDLAHVCQ